MTSTDIRNEAYNIFTDGKRTESRAYNDMQKFLWEQVKAGNISALEKCRMAKDIMESAGQW